MTTTPRLCLMLSLALTTSPAAATAVFTWVDDAGVTHFSESPPTGISEVSPDLQLIEIEPDYPSANRQTDDNDYYSVVNQANRMTARRLQNEKLDAEKKQANAEASKALAEADAINQADYDYRPSGNDRYYPVYPYYPRKHYPYRPGHGHKPVHPVHPVQPIQARSKSPRTSLGKTPGMPHY